MTNNKLLLILLTIVSLGFTACSSGEKSKSTMTSDAGSVSMLKDERPLNLTIYLDLSDRLLKNKVSEQMESDTTIIDYLFENIFLGKCKKSILKSKDHFQIFFYPAPAQSDINQLSTALNLDLSKFNAPQKKEKSKEFQSTYKQNVEAIYQRALTEKKYIGSDIWGFFSNKKVDVQCVRPGNRNVLVILTDGYIFHQDNKVKEGNTYSYVLDQTLAIPGSSLIVKRDGLEDLEVLVLEVNPTSPKLHDRLYSVLEEWFGGMGVNKVQIAETDVTANTIAVINNFFAE